MPIKNKDGTPYKLQGINPLMKEQDHWEDGWTLHHVGADEVVIQDPKKVIPEELMGEKIIPSIIGGSIISQTEILYCLPIIIKIEEDPLYGQSKRVVTWGDKFNFEAIRIDCTGLTALFFARLPSVKLEVGSIIYVFKERQWWKVNGTEPSEDGINIYCVPSELKPSFI